MFAGGREYNGATIWIDGQRFKAGSDLAREREREREGGGRL